MLKGLTTDRGSIFSNAFTQSTGLGSTLAESAVLDFNLDKDAH